MPIADLPHLPTECAFCRKAASEAEGFQICQRVDWEGGIHVGALCSDCVRHFLMQFAFQDRAAFEKLVEEARAYKPDSDTPESAN